jgi:hypothetical protein
VLGLRKSVRKEGAAEAKDGLLEGFVLEGQSVKFMFFDIQT